MLTIEGYKCINHFIGNKALLLMGHESKKSAHTGFPLSNYTHLRIDERNFYCVSTNIFKQIIDNDILLYATKQYADKFSTGNAYDVVEAVYLSTKEKLPVIYEFYKNRLDNFLELLRGAHCYIVEYTAEVLGDKVLRLDLFRCVRENKASEGNYDFVGGLFHSFKHISVEGVNLSVGVESNVEIYNPMRIINYAVKSFFFTKLVTSKKDNKFTSLVYFDDRYGLLFVYHYERTPDVYFVDTIRKEKNH